MGSAYVFDQGHHRVIIVDDFFFALMIQEIYNGKGRAGGKCLCF